MIYLIASFLLLILGVIFLFICVKRYSKHSSHSFIGRVLYVTGVMTIITLFVVFITVLLAIFYVKLSSDRHKSHAKQELAAAVKTHDPSKAQKAIDDLTLALNSDTVKSFSLSSNDDLKTLKKQAKTVKNNLQTANLANQKSDA